MVAEQPLDTHLLGQLLELSPTVVEELCHELAAGYDAEGRGFQLARVAGGWRFQSHPDQAPYVERFVLAGQTAKLSAAALETLVPGDIQALAPSVLRHRIVPNFKAQGEGLSSLDLINRLLSEVKPPMDGKASH